MLLRPSFIHILKLEENKFFIVQSKQNVIKTINNFKKISDWIQKYPYRSIMKEDLDPNQYSVNIWTLKYIEKFGLDNVRGGSFYQLNLSDKQKDLINYNLNLYIKICIQCNKKNFIPLNFYYLYGFKINDCDDEYTEYDLFFKIQCIKCNRY